MKKIIHILFFFNLTVPLFSQLTFSASINKMGTIDIDNCTVEFFRTPNGGIVHTKHNFVGIAVHPEGRLFASGGVESEPYIFELDVLTKQIIDTVAATPESFNGLTFDKNGLLYAGQDRVYTYNLITGEIKDLGDFPGPNVVSGGLVFYEDELYATSIDYGNTLGRLFKLNLEDLENSTEMFMPFVNRAHLSLTTYCNENNERVLIGGYANRDSKTTYLEQLDLDSQTIDTLCAIDFMSPNSKVIEGLISNDEFRINCSLRLDLDKDNSSGRMLDHYLIDELCSINFSIADEDIKIQTTFSTIDSLVVTLAEGEQHPEQEVFNGSFANTLEVKGMGTSRLSLINQGAAGIEDFATAIQAIRFQILADEVIDGERILETRIYSNGEQSDPAKTFIIVNTDRQTNAGQDGIATVCEGLTVDLFRALRGSPEPNGFWHPTLAGEDNRYRSLEDQPGIFQYITNAGGCSPDTALVEVIEYPDPQISLNGEQVNVSALCLGDTIVWDVTVDNAVEYLWRDDYTESIRFLTEEGIYSVDVLDENGCYWFAKVVVQLEEEFVINDTINLCEGEKIDFYGQVLTTSGSYAVELINETTCDSLVNLELIVNPTYSEWIDTTIVEGETVQIGEQIFSTSGVYSVELTTQNGCDSTVVFNLNVLPDSTTSIKNVNREETLIVFPNPAAQNLNIQLPNHIGRDYYFEIIDVTGKIISRKENREDVIQQLVIDVTDLNEGLYFLKLVSKEKWWSSTFVIHH